MGRIFVVWRRGIGVSGEDVVLAAAAALVVVWTAVPGDEVRKEGTGVVVVSGRLRWLLLVAADRLLLDGC